jgi:flagellar biosynthesis/type III secretory pathway protein FliH
MNRDGTDSHFIVRAPRLRAGDSARAIVTAAEERAEGIVAAANAGAARIRADVEAQAEAALVEARARGRAEAAAEAAVMIARTAEALDRFWREREDELRDVALAVAHRVLSALPRDEIQLRLATEAIAEHGRDARLALKTLPDMAVALRSALSGLEFGDRVTVSPDPSLEPGGCTLLHPQGRTEIGLLAQFRSMLAGAGGRG